MVSELNIFLLGEVEMYCILEFSDELEADGSIFGEMAVEIHRCLAFGVSVVSVNPSWVTNECVV